MDARSITMDATSDAPTGCARVIFKTVVALSLPFVLSPREVATEAASNMVAAFTTCFSRLRQRNSQFNDEHREALLKKDEYYSEAAMIELRRRVMEDRTSAMPAVRWDPMATDQPACPPRWNERKVQEFARAKSSVSPTCNWRSPEKAFTTLASDTEKALDQLLKSTRKTRKHCNETIDAEIVDRQERGEVLEYEARKETDVMPPEETGAETVLLDIHHGDESCNGRSLRAWLAGIDTCHSEEYCAYAKQLEEHGFIALEDLAQLKSEDDVDQAMSEVGIAKFAHRLRIRKAIRQLHYQCSEETLAAAARTSVAASAY